jgi:hypothetical protein
VPPLSSGVNTAEGTKSIRGQAPQTVALTEAEMEHALRQAGTALSHIRQVAVVDFTSPLQGEILPLVDAWTPLFEKIKVFSSIVDRIAEVIFHLNFHTIDYNDFLGSPICKDGMDGISCGS